jgi:hypothetical protein
MRKDKFAAKRNPKPGNRWTKKGEGGIIHINMIGKEFLL